MCISYNTSIFSLNIFHKSTLSLLKRDTANSANRFTIPVEPLTKGIKKKTNLISLTYRLSAHKTCLRKLNHCSTSVHLGERFRGSGLLPFFQTNKIVPSIMVSTPPHYNLKICQNFVETKVFLVFVEGRGGGGGKPLWGELKLYRWSHIY